MDRVGIIQMTSGPDPWQNLAVIREQVESLAKQQVAWVVTPENALVFGKKQDYHAHAEVLGGGPLQAELSDIAQQFGVWLLIGSMPIQTDQGVTTTSILFDPHGQQIAHYDKLHMFDVDVADGHKRYRESEIFTPGQQIVLAKTPFANLGLTICYDVRFPHLYAELARQGANVFVVPAAFTAVTGKAHWEVLLRARAIENQAWVVAVNQCATHPCGRETWGHSMVISPWGEIVASLDNQPSVLTAELCIEQVQEVRTAMPTGQHVRFETQLK
ncbi:Predicted amidohydrolase [Vibrio xiamenensis]|uniref:Predicted amidohydrolase n=1 Tax=Vibrio xiamenensis TaxID=861298 RepID=A0A1G8BTB1_9VIBR|nr:carbon-nitrogen hydrolase family protein [Vibrio xiamenensis]SDH36381.1 Predicted amidohydrolase [Vibrio xiamenensis]